MSDSCVDIIQDLQKAFEEDEALQAFAKLKWGRKVSVRIVYKERAELTQKDLPKILLTLPHVDEEDDLSILTVRLYCGFHQNSDEKGPIELIEFSEKVGAVIETVNQDDKRALFKKKGIATDEGKWHPYYFFIRAIEITVPT